MSATQIVGGVGGQYDIVFDATAAYTISFTYSGNQVIKNRLIVKNNATNVTVFDDTVTSMALRHVIPANTLSNGTLYNLTIQVSYYNAENVETTDTISDTALVKCLTTPVVTCTNSQSTIRNAVYSFAFSYTQAEDDLIDYYTISLYDSGNILLYSLATVYPAPSTTAYNFTASISDLFDGSSYSVRCVATSVAGMTADTGMISFAVQYVRPQNYSILYVENAPTACAAKINSNIKIIDGFTVSGATPTYIDSSKVDLRNYGITYRAGAVSVSSQFQLLPGVVPETVYWEGMIDVSGQFQLLAEVAAFAPYKDMISVSNGSTTVTLKAMQGLMYGEASEKIYILLTCNNGYETYMVISNLLDVPTSDDDYYLISLVRRNNVYEVTLALEVRT